MGLLLTRRPFFTMSASCTLRSVLICSCLLMVFPATKGTIIRSLIKNNLAGPDLNFQKVDWPFDPDEGRLRSVDYQRVNGQFGWRAIEKVGLGEDGKADVRREQQQYRDSIGALTYKVPGWDS